MSEVRSVSLNLSSKELVFLQKVTRQEYHFITEEEQQARLRAAGSPLGRQRRVTTDGITRGEIYDE